MQKKAAQTGSHILSLLAERVERDSFANIKKTVKDPIVKLMEEANEEAEHKVAVTPCCQPTSRLAKTRLLLLRH